MRLVERPAGAAALGDLQDLRRALRAPANCRRHALATLRARRRRLRLRRRRRHDLRRHHRLFGADPSPGRSDLAGAALDPLDRLGAAVHPVVRHLRGVEDHPDRGRRVLSGLSRRHGRGDLGRPQDRRGRPRVPPVRLRHGAAHPAAGGDAGLCALAARGPRARLDVRGRGRVSRRVAGPGLPADRRPAARQAGDRSSPRSSPSRSSARPPTAILAVATAPLLRWEDRFART